MRETLSVFATASRSLLDTILLNILYFVYPSETRSGFCFVLDSMQIKFRLRITINYLMFEPYREKFGVKMFVLGITKITPLGVC